MANFQNSTLCRDWFFNGDKTMLDKFFVEKTKQYLANVARFINLNNVPSRSDNVQEKVALFELKPEQENKILISCIDDLKALFLVLETWTEKDSQLQNANVIAIAMTYFHRFFLKKSVFEYDPQNILYACLFLAAKVEEFSLTHESFCKIFKLDPVAQQLVLNEQILIQVINYQLHVVTPVQSLQSLVFRLEEFIFSPKVVQASQQQFDAEYRRNLVKKLQRQSFAFIYLAMRNRELVFCVSPSLIAMAALDRVLQQQASTLQIVSPALTSLEALIAASFVREEIEAIGAPGSERFIMLMNKVKYVQQCVDELELTAAQILKDAKTGKSLLKKRHAKFPEFRLSLERERQARLNQIEPAGFWQDLDSQTGDKTSKGVGRQSKQKIGKQPESPSQTKAHALGTTLQTNTNMNTVGGFIAPEPKLTKPSLQQTSINSQIAQKRTLSQFEQQNQQHLQDSSPSKWPPEISDLKRRKLEE